jgi:hypothetical protein
VLLTADIAAANRTIWKPGSANLWPNAAIFLCEALLIKYDAGFYTVSCRVSGANDRRASPPSRP